MLQSKKIAINKYLCVYHDAVNNHEAVINHNYRFNPLRYERFVVAVHKVTA